MTSLRTKFNNRKIITFRLLFTIVSIACFLSSCAPEISQKSKAALKDLRLNYSEILKLLPAKGEETKIIPESPIPDLGYVEGSEDLDIPVIEEGHLRDISKSKEVSKDESIWISSAQTGWNTFDLKPFRREGYYRVKDHDNDVAHFKNTKFLLIFRTSHLDKGEIKGENIVRGASYEGWFWLIDREKKQIVGSRKMKAEFIDDYIIYEEGSDVLGNRLRQRIYGYTQYYLNEWNNTDDVGYI